MIYLITAVLAFLFGLLAGLLVGRKNPSVADDIQALIDKGK